MKVFAEPTFFNYAISRISDALIKYAPEKIEFVDDVEDADLVVVYVYGHRRKIWWHTSRLKDAGKKYIIVQLVVRSTRNPNVSDWKDIWEGAEFVWSYYDLNRYCAEDNIKIDFNFYHAPLGIDKDVFKETPTKRINKIVIGDNRDESVNECVLAAKGKVFRLGKGITDDDLAKVYSASQFVSGLRRTEGFEMPVLEGLMCGARPICYDRPHYREWFGDHVEYIQEAEPKQVIATLIGLFSQGPREVGNREKVEIIVKFSWEKICTGFWEKI